VGHAAVHVECLECEIVKGEGVFGGDGQGEVAAVGRGGPAGDLDARGGGEGEGTEQLGGGGAEQADNGVGGERADEVEVEGSPGGVGGIGCVAEASVGDAAVGVAGVQIERVIPAGANEEPGAQVGQRL